MTIETIQSSLPARLISSRARRMLSAAAVLLLSCGSLLGQSFQARISGQVKDPSGAVVRDAEIRAIDTAKGTEVVTKTNSRGEYEFPSLLPSSYQLRATSPGFGVEELDSIVLQVDQNLKLDITLKVGRATEAVQVNATTLDLETQDASLGQVVTQQQIEELPLPIRDPLALIALTPGAVLGPDFGAGGGPSIGRNFAKNNFNVGGGKSGSQAIFIDGAPDTTGDQSKALINPPLDAVQEFKVQAISYSAQFGRTSGTTINLLTKSGTNTIHGAIYDFERNSIFNATNYFSQGNTTDYGTHQAGAVVGFPIRHDKWFGFVDYELLRQSSPETNVDTVPTDAERNGDFTGLTYTSTSAAGVTTSPAVIIYDPATYNAGTGLRQQIVGCDGVTKNVICSTRISPIAKNFLARVPEPNTPGLVNGINNFVYTANQVTSSDKTDFRTDFNINDKTSVFGRFSYQNDRRTVPGALPPSNTGGSTNDIYSQVVLSLSRVISTNLLGSLTTSFVRGNAIQVGSLPPLDITSYGFSSHFASQAAPQLPDLSMSDITDIQYKSNVNQQHQPRNTYATSALMTYLHGRNAMKFGGEWWILDFNEYQNAVSSGLLLFNHFFTQQTAIHSTSHIQGSDIADLLLGYPSGINPVSNSRGSYIENDQAISTRGLYYAAFFQNDFRASDKLTLNLGIRWDVSIGDREKYNRLAWFDPNAPSPLGPSIGNPALKGQVVWVGGGNDIDQQKTSWSNLNPRFGFAYQMKKNFVIRGGYGIYFLPRSVQGNGVGALGGSVLTEAPLDGPLPSISFADPFAAGVLLPNNNRDPISGVGTSISIPTHEYHAAYVQLFSLGFQREMPGKIILDVHYWSNIGNHIPTTAYLNQLSNQVLAACTAANNCSTLASTKVANPFYGVIPNQPATTTLRQSELPYPQYSGDDGIAQQLVPVGHTDYNALTVQAMRRLSSSLSFTAQYTWGKAMDNLGTPISYVNRRQIYGESSLDVTNQFIGSFIVSLPYGHGRRWGSSSGRVANGLLGDWNVNGIVSLQSGLPIQISTPSTLSAGAVIPVPHPSPAAWFNNAAGTFSDAIYSYGNIGKNLPGGVRTDHTRNLNAVIEKNFRNRIRQHETNLQIRAESYNVFNHPQFAAPNGTISSTAFGTINAQLNQPRAFQFGAKLKF